MPQSDSVPERTPEPAGTEHVGSHEQPADEAAESVSNLGTVAARGAAVTIAGQVVRILLQVTSVVVLSRLVAPADYGLLAIVLLVVGLGELFRDAGLSSAAVAAPELSRAQRDNLFWLNTAIGAGLGLIVVVAAPLIAMVFAGRGVDPTALTTAMRLLAITFVINGAATQYRAGLNRTLRFSALAVIDLAAQVLALAIAVVLAIGGSGLWALVSQQLVTSAGILVGVVVVGRWLPGRYDRRAPVGELLRYGRGLLGSQLVGYLTNNLDVITLAARTGPSALGVYNRVFQLLMNPLGQLRNPTTTVALPVLARLPVDDDRARRLLLTGQLALGYSLIPFLAVAAGAARPAVAVFLGPQWAQGVPVLALLSVAGAFQTLAFVGYWVYLARGLTAQLLRYSLFQLVLKAVFIGIGSTWGVVGVAAGYAMEPAVEWSVSLWWLSRITVYPRAALARGGLRLLALGLTAGLGAWVATLVPVVAVVQLGLAAVAAAGTYGLAWLLIPAVREDVGEVAALLRRVRGNSG